MFRRRKDGKPAGNWYFWHPEKGRVSTGTSDRALAKAIVAKAETEAAQRKAGLYVPTFGEQTDTWLELNRTVSGIVNQEGYAKFWKQHIGARKLAEVTKDLVHTTMKAHRAVRLDEACRENATANNYVAFVAKIIRTAEMQPPKFHQYPVKRKGKRWLRRDEWPALASAMGPDLRHVATFSVATGLRSANVAFFEWAWIHGDKAFLPPSVTKTGEAYGIPLNKAAQAAIEERKNSAVRHTRFVFLNEGRPWTRHTYYVAVQRAAEAAGLEGINVHTFRHTFASWLAQAGTPDAIRKRLGCWSLGSSADAGYLHFDVEPLRPFAEKLDACLGFVSPDLQGTDLQAVSGGAGI